MNFPDDESRSGWLAAVRFLDHAGWPTLLHAILRSLRHDLVSRLTGLNLIQSLARSRRDPLMVGEVLGEEGQRLEILSRQLECVAEREDRRVGPLDPSAILRGVLLVHSSVAQVPFDRHVIRTDPDTPAIQWDRTLAVRSLLLALDAVGPAGRPLELELGVAPDGRARLRIRGLPSDVPSDSPAPRLTDGPLRTRMRLLAALYRSQGGYLRAGTRRGVPTIEVLFPGAGVASSAEERNGYAG